MASYGLSVRTTATAAASAALELIAGATQRIRLRQIIITEVTAVAGEFGWGRPAAIGVTPTSPVLGDGHDTNDAAAVGKIALAWGTGPTVPAKFRHRAIFAAAIGAGIVWEFPRDAWVINPNASGVLWIIATAPVCNVAMEWEE